MTTAQSLMLAALAAGGAYLAWKMLSAKGKASSIVRNERGEALNKYGRTADQQSAYDTATKWAEAEAVRQNALSADAKAREAEVAAAEKQVAQMNASTGKFGPKVSLDDFDLDMEPDLGVLYNW